MPEHDAWDDAMGASSGLVGGGAPSLAARLDAWLADARVERAAEERSRERWLGAAAEADATLAGILLDLAERGTAVAVATGRDRRHHGHLQVLGTDFVALRAASGAEVLVAVRAMTSVRTAPTVAPAAGARVVTTELCLAEVLSELAAERARALLVLLDGADSVAGELRFVGQDVVAVRTTDELAGTAYVPVAAIAEVTLA